MSEGARRPPRVSREMRLLIVTILIAGSVLLLLARLRFPERPAALATSAQPLERLAARASFEELATQVARVETAVAPNLLVLSLAPDEARPIGLADASGQRASDDAARHVPALRIETAAAVACIPPGARIGGVIGEAGRIEVADIEGMNVVRHVARVRVPQGEPPALRPLVLSALRTPTYVVAIEGTRAGVTVRPVFLGRSDRFTAARWGRPLLPLGGAAVTPGALIFTLDGEFLGCAVADEGTAAIAPAADVLEAASRTVRDGLREPGLTVQPLTAELGAATGAARGVVVAEVLENGAATGVLEPGDVIVDIGGQPARDPRSVLLDLGARLNAGAVDITFVRAGQTRQARLEPPPQPAAPAGSPEPTFAALPRVGVSIVSMPAGSPLEAAGLRRGDIIVRVGDIAAPTPAQVAAALRDTPAGRSLLVVVRRGTRQHVTAVRQEIPGNAASR